MQQFPQHTLSSTDDDAARNDCGYCFHSEAMDADAELLGLAREVEKGARWFYSIGGLTALNSVLALVGAGGYFVLGLGVAHLIRAFTMGVFLNPDPLAGPNLILAAILEWVFALAFVAAGRAASRGFGPAFVLGGLPYALDAAFCLEKGLYMSLAFHVVALFCISKGYVASRTLSLKQSIPRDARPRWTWRTYAESGAPMAVFVPIVLSFVVGLALPSKQWELAELQVLARAPESFFAIDRERHHRAWLAVAARFERDGAVSMEEGTRMNEVLFKIVRRPEGRFASRQELLELIEVLEAVGRIEAPALVACHGSGQDSP